jgi:hypothetical protein
VLAADPGVKAPGFIDRASQLAWVIDEDPGLTGQDLMAAGYEAVYRRALAASVEPAMVPPPVPRGGASAITASTVTNGR